MWPYIVRKRFDAMPMRILLLVAVLSEVVSEQGHVFFNVDIYDLSGFSRIQNNASQTACAIECEKETNCRSFSFDNTTKICIMGNSIGPAMRMTKGENTFDCPVNKGFTVYLGDTLSLCMKIHLSGTYYTKAQSECGGYGGHLLVVNNVTVHELVKIVLPTNVGGIWIDGEDLYANDTMYSLTGKPLEWVAWGFDDPDGGNQDCLNLNSNTDFSFYDAGCGMTYPYACQID